MQVTINLSHAEVQQAIRNYMSSKNINIIIKEVTINEAGEVIVKCEENKSCPYRY